VSAGRRIVHVRINDSATGLPTPARVQFKSGAGEYFPPLGRLSSFPTDPNQDVGGNVLVEGERYSHVEGSFEIPLPADPISVRISKGPEYRPVDAVVQVGPGKMALRFALERWCDLRQERWYSGDSRAHYVSPHAALLEAAGEDLAVVNLLAREDGVEPCSIANILAFSGQQPALAMPGQMVVVNTLNQHQIQGNLSLLNCHRVVFPLRAGGSWAYENWNLDDWCAQCHRKGGLVVWPDTTPTVSTAKLPEGIDAWEITNFEKGRLSAWHEHLNAGRRLPIIGGSGKSSNSQLLGSVRTYARLQPGQDFSYKNWIESIRAGRTFVTNGPLLQLTVNDRGPGETVTHAPEMRIRAEARGLAPFSGLEIIANGEVIAATSDTGRSAVVEATIELPRGGWLNAACPGMAQTSPIYVK
jgi:hypothetical protein